MPGYWRRPVARVYNYNLDLGENYYSPMRDYVQEDRERLETGRRGESPGPLTYSERISRKFMEGDTDRLLRARSEVKSRESRARTEAAERAAMRSAIRATSEVKPVLDCPPSPGVGRGTGGTSGTGYQAVHGTGLERAESVLSAHRRLIREISEDTTKRVSDLSPRYADDCIYKKMADIRLSPWRGDEMDIEHRQAVKARSRINGMERELDDITKNLMSYRPNYESAHSMSTRAQEEDKQQTTHTVTRKVVSEESHSRQRC